MQLWVSKSSSFAGRFRLISFVIFSIQNYLSFKCLLPSKGIKANEKLCGKEGSSPHQLALKLLGVGVSGLGLRKMKVWNPAFLLKTNSRSLTIWLFVGWKKGMWRLKSPADCSWNWRKLLRSREITYGAKKSMFSGIGGNNPFRGTLGIHMDWISLVKTDGLQIIHQSGLSVDALVADVIRRNEWFGQALGLTTRLEFKNAVGWVPFPNPHSRWYSEANPRC